MHEIDAFVAQSVQDPNSADCDIDGPSGLAGLIAEGVGLANPQRLLGQGHAGNAGPRADRNERRGAHRNEPVKRDFPGARGSPSRRQSEIRRSPTVGGAKCALVSALVDV
jgi:hypothetical protein